MPAFHHNGFVSIDNSQWKALFAFIILDDWEKGSSEIFF